jgi:murein L,D-transpeptidase YafK
MKQFLWIALWVLVFSVLKTEGQTRAEMKVPVFSKQPVPSSPRSVEAIQRIAPSLIRDLAAQGLSYGSPIFIRFFKQEREMEVWLKKGEQYEKFRTYLIAAMSGELGPKLQEGDGQAPEGFYSVKPEQMNPLSDFHLSFNLGFPNAYDRAYGRTGSVLMVHGNQVSIGCYAMTDPKIEEIYTLADAALRNGQSMFQVHCFPFRMTDEQMGIHARSEWIDYWKNLKQGYDYFEKFKQPPNVAVKDKTYTFEKDR